MNFVNCCHDQQGSAVDGPRGLFAGDQVTAINECAVQSMDDWSRCVGAAIRNKPGGYCMPLDLVKQQDISFSG